MKPIVLITGASTGIGFATAVHLAKTHHVLAQVRKPQHGEKLKAANPEIDILQFDVTDEKSTQNAIEQLDHLKFESFSLINNAGITVQGPVEAVRMEDWRQQFEVNFFGVIQLTQKCLPMIRQTKGRIINISSVSGRVSSGFLGPYASSKFALNAISDSLRRELSPLGVKVIVIEPGPIQTPIWEKALAQKNHTNERMNQEILKNYESDVEKFVASMENSARGAEPIELVIQAIDEALCSENPKARYPVGKTAKLTTLMGQLLPDAWMDALIRKS